MGRIIEDEDGSHRAFKLTKNHEMCSNVMSIFVECMHGHLPCVDSLRAHIPWRLAPMGGCLPE